jgi:hypothetical protein
MLAARTNSSAVFLVLALCLIYSPNTCSQSTTFLHASKSPNGRTSSGAWPAKCQASPIYAPGRELLGNGIEWPGVETALPGDSSLPSAREVLCEGPAVASPSRTSADDPCTGNVTQVLDVHGIFRSSACHEPEDAAVAELSGLGRAGVKIARARQEVLDILGSGNACAEWFATKDPNPAETFRSLSFLLDKRGQQKILESEQPAASRLWRQPYVARATQDGGAHTAITINAYGAFYRTQGNVVRVAPEGGPFEADGTRLLTVGSYQGDTLPARMVTLLHEFGHIIDLLPEDADNLDGKSVRNTDEVLRHCRAEVQARTQQAKQTANP